MQINTFVANVCYKWQLLYTECIAVHMFFPFEDPTDVAFASFVLNKYTEEIKFANVLSTTGKKRRMTRSGHGYK